jgi:hypothetical protein
MAFDQKANTHILELCLPCTTSAMRVNAISRPFRRTTSYPREDQLCKRFRACVLIGVSPTSLYPSCSTKSRISLIALGGGANRLIPGSLGFIYHISTFFGIIHILRVFACRYISRLRSFEPSLQSSIPLQLIRAGYSLINLARWDQRGPQALMAMLIYMGSVGTLNKHHGRREPH